MAAVARRRARSRAGRSRRSKAVAARPAHERDDAGRPRSACEVVWPRTGEDDPAGGGVRNLRVRCETYGCRSEAVVSIFSVAGTTIHTEPTETTERIISLTLCAL